MFPGVMLRLLRAGAAPALTRRLSYVERARLLDRLKTDETECVARLAGGRFLLHNAGRPLLHRTAGPAWLDFTTAVAAAPGLSSSSAALLGVAPDGVVEWAASLPPDTDTAQLEAATGARFTDLRAGLFMVDGEMAKTLTKAWSLLKWGERTRYCAVCAAALVRAAGGAGARCPACGAVFYPATSPVGIVSVSDPEQDRLLLVRTHQYPPGMFSCIAGFLDPGETLEDCVRREVAEEAGLEVDRVTYTSSQHWPFPAGSLMVGCHAHTSYPGQTPSPDPAELEAAAWFTREEVAAAVQRIDSNPRLRAGRGSRPDQMFIPPRGALAYTLVTNWLTRGENKTRCLNT